MKQDDNSHYKSYYPYELSDVVFDGRVYRVDFNLLGDILNIFDHGAIDDVDYGDGRLVLDPSNDLMQYLQNKVDATLSDWAEYHQNNRGNHDYN